MGDNQSQRVSVCVSLQTHLWRGAKINLFFAFAMRSVCVKKINLQTPSLRGKKAHYS